MIAEGKTPRRRITASAMRFVRATRVLGSGASLRPIVLAALVLAFSAPGALLAQPETAPAGGTGQAAPPPILAYLVPIGVIMLLFYFIILRPQRKEQKTRQGMLDAVAKGDEVVTVGGIHGLVESVDAAKGIVKVTIAPKITIKVNKSSLTSVTPKGKGGKGKDSEKEQKETAKAK